MFKKILFLVSITSIVLIVNTSSVFAVAIQPGGECNPDPKIDSCCSNNLYDPKDPNTGICVKPNKDFSCQPSSEKTDNDNTINYCSPNVNKFFGVIKPPPPLAKLLEKNQTGAGVISMFLSNGIILIYSIAAVVLLFMIIWGAFQWMTSGGSKEQLAAAQQRILHAIIGILLFAAAFAILQVLGTFTGFKFFKSQNAKIIQRNADGTVFYICSNEPPPQQTRSTRQNGEEPICP